MPIIVVGGHSRKAGKTSVTAGLIHAFRQHAWTAVKISSHQHSNIPILPPGRDESCLKIFEEKDCGGTSDTSRFLAAGASRSFWMQIKNDFTADTLCQFSPILKSNPFVLIESNRILRLIRPDLFIMVLRYDVADFKKSAQQVLDLADAVVAVNPNRIPAPWPEISHLLPGIQQFVTADPQAIPSGLIDFVRKRLQIPEQR